MTPISGLNCLMKTRKGLTEGEPDRGRLNLSNLMHSELRPEEVSRCRHALYIALCGIPVPLSEQSDIHLISRFCTPIRSV